MIITVLAFFESGELRLKIRNRPVATNPTVKASGTNLNHKGPQRNETQAKSPTKIAITSQASPNMTFNVLIQNPNQSTVGMVNLNFSRSKPAKGFCSNPRSNQKGVFQCQTVFPVV